MGDFNFIVSSFIVWKFHLQQSHKLIVMQFRYGKKSSLAKFIGIILFPLVISSVIHPLVLYRGYVLKTRRNGFTLAALDYFYSPSVCSYSPNWWFKDPPPFPPLPSLWSIWDYHRFGFYTFENANKSNFRLTYLLVNCRFTMNWVLAWGRKKNILLRKMTKFIVSIQQ